MRQSLALFAALPLLIAAPAAADDWPCLRGPHLDGVSWEEGPIPIWPESGPTVLWTQPLGPGYSAFAVSDGKAVTQYQTAFQQVIACFDASTGDKLWEVSTGPTYEATGLYPGPRATPAIADGRVYYVTPETDLGCLSLATGEQIWLANLNQLFDGKGTEFGYAASPLVRNGRVILPVGGKSASVVAFNASNGSFLWQQGDEPASYCMVLPIQLQGHNLLVNYLRNHITICEEATGRRLWTHDISVGYDEHAAMPVWSEPYLIFSAPFRSGATAYQLSFADTSQDTSSEEPNSSQPPRLSVEQAWQSDIMSNDTASSIALDGMLLGFDLRDQQAKAHRPSRGTFRCLDCATGQLLWSDPEIGHATAIGVGKQLVLFTDSGDLILGSATRDGFQQSSRTTVFTDEICWTPPAYSNGRLYLRSPSQAVCLELRPTHVDQTQASVPRITTSDLPKTRRLRFSWLIGGEREHPFMIAPIEDVRRWFFAAIATVIAPAALLAAGLGSTTQQQVRIFASTCAGLGGAATPALNTANWSSNSDDQFWFVLPAAVFGFLILALGESDAYQRNRESKRSKRSARAAGLALIAVSFGYFWILRDQSLPHEWVYLVGLLPAALVGSALMRLPAFHRSRVVTIAALVTLFPVFFWTGPLFQTIREIFKGTVIQE